MSDNLAVTVRNVSKTFKLPHEKNSSIKGAIINFYRRNRTYEKLEALKDISFDIKEGEFFGIVGRNGSGKSTLLKLLAGIYVSEGGSIQVNGKLTPFIELGVGFSPELTGRENIFLNGALLGFNRKEMNVMYQDIVEFAELERFMDQKLKNYSSGMQVRLAFSIAIRVQGDILLLDEVLAVGDSAFQQKCYNYFNDLKRQKKTVIFVTHDMAAVRRFCDRGILINSGKIEEIGTPNDIARAYDKINLQNSDKRLVEENKAKKSHKNRTGNGQATIDLVETFNTVNKKIQTTFSPEEKIGIRITFKAKQDINAPTLGYIIQDEQDRTVFATSNKIKAVKTMPVRADQTVTLESTMDNVFTNGEYSIACAIENEDLSVIYDRMEHVHKFLIGGHELAHAMTHPPHTFQVDYSQRETKD
jgi:ABC-2 type transport system ATP-binding protein